MRISDRVVLGSTLRSHIGGRWAISWIAYVINAPINLLSISSNVVDARGASPLAWLGVWALGYAALGLVLLLANDTLFRNRRVIPVPIWWVFALGAVAGGLRGLVVGIAAYETGISGGGEEIILLRLLTGTLFGMVLIPSAALLLSLITSYSAQRRALIANIVDLERERMQAEGESDRLREMLLADVERGANEAAADEQVRSARELSHRLWNEAESHTARSTLSTPWRGVLRDVFTNYPYPAGIVAGIWAVSAIWTLTAAIGFTRGAAQTVVSVIVIWGAFTIASRIRLSSGAARLLLFIATLLVVDVLTGPVASVIFDPRPPGAGNGQIVANSMWIPLLAILAGVIVSGVRSGEEVLGRLTTEVREEQIAAMAAQDERARVQREVAEALHGVQSRLISTRVAGDPAALSLAEVLNSPWITDPGARLDRTIATWGLLLELEIAGVPDDLSDERRRDVARIVDEACSNAYRHGHAKRCTVEVISEGASVLVRVRDDGSGVREDRSAGLGSGVFDSISGGDWTLESAAGATLLSVRLHG